MEKLGLQFGHVVAVWKRNPVLLKQGGVEEEELFERQPLANTPSWSCERHKAFAVIKIAPVSDKRMTIVVIIISNCKVIQMIVAPFNKIGRDQGLPIENIYSPYDNRLDPFRTTKL